MITVIYSTHKDPQYNSNFKQHLTKSIGIKDFEILEFQNNNQYSLAQVYNMGINQAKFNIIVCCHNDIKLENGWGKKLIQDFTNNPDYGIIGKAGSCYFPSSGVYWEKMNQTMVGQVYHHPPGKKKWLNKYSTKLPFLVPVVTIDGLFISFDKRKIKQTFDESIGRFHFYDHLFCLPNFLDGVKIGVTSSFEITHESVGMPNEEFFETKEKFIKKWGHKLPLDLKPEKILVEKIKTTNLKNIKKVAVIIPTKGNLDILFNCINSFIEHCDSSYYEIFVADTGSSDNEKQRIKEFIEDNKEKVTIHFIEYNYYNFAKINNDVVKNHISDDFEFLLFCNNDIKILNNVIQEMVTIFKENKNTGTVGARLHFNDNTIQHDSIIIVFRNDKKRGKVLHITHDNLRAYYKYTTNNKEVLGNTAALLMMKKNIFIKCGMFNENYISCFEDVELNLKCNLLGLKNYLSGKSVAYHYESITRNEDTENIKKLAYDYENNLKPFVYNNINKLKKQILYE
jgi:GT2 family glycosyltransferase